MKKFLILSLTVILAFGIFCGATVTANAEQTVSALDIKARSALLMDYDTGTIVFAKNEKERMPIASMVKIMTLLLALEDIDAGKLSVDDTVRASENAASMGGSQAFLDAGSDYTVNELLKSIVVGSANDSCVAIAEHISGSVDTFVARMNEKAKSLGMLDTRFINCTGLPGAEQYCCAHDVALMTRALISHEKFFDYSKVWMFDFAHPSGIVTQLSNTNKLIRAYEGCDGGKTGFTNDAKFCLSATAKRGDTRLISVVCGAESSKVRNAQNAALFNFGFANYETKQVVKAGIATDTEYSVSGGKESAIKAVPAADKFVFLKKGDTPALEYNYEISELRAPIESGDVIGTLKVTNKGEAVCEVPLVSDRTVLKSGYLDIVDDFIANW